MALAKARPCGLSSKGLDSLWLVVRLPLEEKLAKHHVEDGEDYNGEERRHLYIDCHHLLHQSLSFSLFLSLNLSALIHDLKRKENTKEERRTSTLHYTKR